MPGETHPPPSLDDIRACTKRLAGHIARTPTMAWEDACVAEGLGRGARVFLKLELLQRTGTFKARAALNNILAARPGAGVTAVSAGNHAIAVAYAARALGRDAKVVMLATANPARVALAKSFGATVLMAEDGAAGFALAHEIAEREGRVFIHPFEGRGVTTATGGVGLELMEDAGPLDAVVVAIGGGGLASGVAAAVKQCDPGTTVYGVEPEGADVMRRSFAGGAPARQDHPRTIADSMAPPMTTPYAFATCRRFVDDIVTVSDDALAAGMALLFARAKLAVEPAGAASLAAALGPLAPRLAGKRVGLIICGANIDRASYCDLLARGERALAAGVL